MSKDCYQTPLPIFQYWHQRFNFKLDAAASSSNALCPFFINEEENTLTTHWAAAAGLSGECGWYAWMNPPYSNIGPFVNRAAEMAKEGIGCVMLVMMDQSVGWYKDAIQTCQEVVLVVGGRISFINPETKLPAAGNNKGSMFLIWHPFGATNVQVSHINRDDLLRDGQVMLDMVAAEANK